MRRRLLSLQKDEYIFPEGTFQDFDYTDTEQSVKCPPGTYKLQVWGAEGSANEADSNYSITSQAGGKGGYSEGILTLVNNTELFVYVGGSNGYNGGYRIRNEGYKAGEYYSNTYKYIKYGDGGGGTDIRLIKGNILSRFIVAGGGLVVLWENLNI